MTSGNDSPITPIPHADRGERPSLSSLATLLVTVTPRERSGARMTNRVEYQKHWALGEILRRHARASEYCIVFELHDDVVVLDAESEPTSAQFYQVKTKTRGHWTLSELLKQDGSSTSDALSILGKLHLHKVNFSHHASALTFVSNVPCAVNHTDDDPESVRESICISDLSEAERARVVAQLRREHGEMVDEGDLALYFLNHSDLALHSTEDHGVGKLEAFLQARFPLRKLPVRGIYRALLGEISRRSGAEVNRATFAELLNSRALTRTAVDSMLRQAGAHSDSDGDWNTLSHFLIAAGFTLQHVHRLSITWKQYEVRRMSPDEIVLQRVRRLVKPLVAGYALQDEPPIGLLLEQCCSSLNLSHDEDIRFLGINLVEAMVLFEYMESYANQLPTPAASAQEEAT